MLKQLTKYFVFAVVVSSIFGCAIPPAKDQSVVDKDKLQLKSIPLYNRAIKHARDGKDKQAIADFMLFNKKYPGVDNSYTNLGLLYLKQGNLELASSFLEKAVTLNPLNKIAHNHLGVVRREQGQFDKAKRSYMQALNIDNDYFSAHYNLGILLDIYLGDLPSALKHYKRFQSLTNKSDKEVSKWVVDLERRILAASKGK